MKYRILLQSLKDDLPYIELTLKENPVDQEEIKKKAETLLLIEYMESCNQEEGG